MGSRLKRAAALVSATAATLGGLLAVPLARPLHAAAASGVDHYAFTTSPIAATGSLAAGQAVAFQVQAQTAANAGVDSATVYLSFLSALGGGTALATGADGVTRTLGEAAQPFLGDGAGHVSIRFSTGATVPAKGVDTVIAQDMPSSPAVTASDAYTYDSITALHLNKTTLAAPNDSATLTAAPAAVRTVYLTFVHSGGGSGGSAKVGLAPVGTAPTAFQTNGSGQLTVTYVAALLNGRGVDTLTATDDAAVPRHTASAFHAYTLSGTASAYRFSASPVAQAGSVAAGGSAPPFTVEADDANGPVGATTVYLGLRRAPGSVSVVKANGSTLGAIAAAFPTDSRGRIALTFQLPSGGNPTQGLDEIVAQDTQFTPTIASGDFYDYASVAGFSYAGVDGSGDIAPPSSLAPNGARVFAAVGHDALGNAVPHAIAWTSASPTTGGGTLQVTGHPVGTDPTAVETDGSGATPPLVYRAPGTSPRGGQDVVLVASTGTIHTPTAFALTQYDFAHTNTLTLTPGPMAPFGSLAAAQCVRLVAGARDTRSGSPGTAVAGATVLLSFLPRPSGGSAAAGGTSCSDPANQSLTAAPRSFTADTSGDVAVYYTAPNPLPTSGVDTVLAQDALTNPVATTSDAYNFAGAAQYAFGPLPIAATGTLSPGATAHVTLTAASPVYLSLVKTVGNGATATATDALHGGSAVQLSATPQIIKPDAGHHIAIVYTASTPLSAGGIDSVVAQNSLTTPSVLLRDTYAYVAQYLFSQAPIAPAGSLDRAAQPTVDITPVDSNGLHVGPGVPVDLALSSLAGADGTATANGTPLTSAAQSIATNGGGLIHVVYRTNADHLPNGGSDILVAANSPGGATVSAFDSYTYQTVATYSFSPTPIAVEGSLAAAETRGILLQLFDNAASSVNGVHQVFLLASPGTLGTFSVNGTPLSATPTAFLTTSSGTLTLQYTAPAPLPRNGGEDAVAAVDTSNLSAVSIFGTDSYRFHVAQGYWMVAADGGIFPFGDAAGHGSTGAMSLNQPIVGMAATADGGGYWLVAADGGIFPFGDAAGGLGSHGGSPLNAPIVGMAATVTGRGYWLVASDGGIFPYGDATQHSYGSEGGNHLNQPIVGMAVTPSGNGYYLVASDGGLFPFGDAVNASYGSTGGMRLNQPIVGMAVNPTGGGYWLVASDGGMFPFGPNACGCGGEGGTPLNQPIVGMAPSFDGGGYYLVASDGGIFPFGDARQGLGSEGGNRLNRPIVGIAAVG